MILRPTPRLFAALHRSGLPAATVACLLHDYRHPEAGAGMPRTILRDIIRAGFQNRHATAHWRPYPRRAVGAGPHVSVGVGAPVSVGALVLGLPGADRLASLALLPGEGFANNMVWRAEVRAMAAEIIARRPLALRRA